MKHEEEPEEITCPNCGLRQEDWVENAGEGCQRQGLLYCSYDCAFGAEVEEKERKRPPSRKAA